MRIFYITTLIITAFVLMSCESQKETGKMPERDSAPGQGAWVEFCEREKDSKLCQTP